MKQHYPNLNYFIYWPKWQKLYFFSSLASVYSVGCTIRTGEQRWLNTGPSVQTDPRWSYSPQPRVPSLASSWAVPGSPLVPQWLPDAPLYWSGRHWIHCLNANTIVYLILNLLFIESTESFNFLSVIVTLFSQLKSCKTQITCMLSQSIFFQRLTSPWPRTTKRSP